MALPKYNEGTEAPIGVLKVPYGINTSLLVVIFVQFIPPFVVLLTSVFAVLAVAICAVLILLISIVLLINDPDKFGLVNVKVISEGDVVVNAFKYLLVVPCVKSFVVFVAKSILNNEVA